ncbi:MAG: Sapep family Mn(2+)-dependent dipeptidase [Ruminococcus sp.]|nr:Sapep family Mn(2+)-dependent dipeptidase [Ruminococcus sp.]
MNFGTNILKYIEDIFNDLKTLLEIKSVSSDGRENCEKALEFILRRAEELGLVTKNIQNKAGHVQLGDSGILCGALTHLDVVPAGKNWSVEPFTLTRQNGRLYGRGIDDDKGASIINLYCLKALKDSGVEGKNTLRCIYGTDEEVGMSDMVTYFENEPLPEISFTPDSDYGICFAEKGILQLKISMDRNDGTTLSAVKAGNAINAVPDEAKALLYFSDADTNNLKKNSKKYKGNFNFVDTIDGLVIESFGKAAHACEPEKGFNAAQALMELLNGELGDDEVGSLCSFIGFALRDETDGTSLGLRMRDFVSGDLSCNLSKIRLNDSKAYLTLDIRYPVTMNGEKILKQVEKSAAINELKVEIIHHAPPLYLSKESPVIELLSEAYEDIMGEKPELYATGGGTYARMLGGKGVAFGPAFKDDNVNMHNADESVDEEKFFKHAQICLQAMYKMYTWDFGETGK